MIFSKAAISTAFLASSVAAFSPKASSSAFVPTSQKTGVATPTFVAGTAHAGNCACSACQSQSHHRGCSCAQCRHTGIVLFSTAEAEADTEEEEDVPAEVEAMDGIESKEEAHNADRPARRSLKKKKGKALSEFSVGDTVSAKVKTITNYGAFLDIGASTDGLLHISQLSVDFVSDVNSILTVGQELDVRISAIDENKGQVGLSLLTAEQEDEAKGASNRSRRQAGDGQRGGGGGGQRRDDSATLSQLVIKGWDSDKFVEGKVVSTVDFGAFVRVDASQLAEGVTGEFDGLVHISALTAGRAESVTSIVSVDDMVQVRVKGIADRKVSLSMVSAEDEVAKAGSGGGGGRPQEVEGAKDWKESLERLQKESMSEFKNQPLFVDLRK